MFRVFSLLAYLALVHIDLELLLGWSQWLSRFRWSRAQRSKTRTLFETLFKEVTLFSGVILFTHSSFFTLKNHKIIEKRKRKCKKKIKIKFCVNCWIICNIFHRNFAQFHFLHTFKPVRPSTKAVNLSAKIEYNQRK